MSESVNMTQELLKEILDYNPETGIFTAKIARGSRIKKGDAAGSTNKNGYIQIQINKKIYYGHRLAWLYVYGYMPPLIDHKDRKTGNNSILNLRSVTKAINARNSKLRADNKSDVCGVFWVSKSKKWIASIRINNKSNHLGYFVNKVDAIRAREIEEAKLGYL